MTAHAKLGASSAHRWMVCPAAPRLEDGIEDITSPFAEEGTLAHEVAEDILTGKMSMSETNMEVELYVEFVQERSHDAEVHIEQRLSYNEWVKDGFGTADAVIITDDDIHIVDLKYGKGLRVNADDNPQLRLYALGALQRWYFDHEPSTVTMSIVQPRLDHISTETMSVDDLLEWAKEAKEAAIATEDEGAKPNPGNKQCQWCRAKGVCRERVIYSLTIPDTDKLTPQEVAEVLPFADEVGAWATSFKVNALRMCEDGTTLPGYKLVAGRSIRKWNDDALEVLSSHVEDPNTLFEKKLLGVTAVQKLVGKKTVDSCTFKPAGKPTLAKSTDKRPSITPAHVDFPLGE